MAEAVTTMMNGPAWVDLASPDAAASRDFYGRLFGWDIEVNPDPQYGGYALAKIKGTDVAGIGPQQTPDSPVAWSFYVGTKDAAALESKVKAAGGNVIAPTFDVGPQGKMAVFQDPAGAFISVWQPATMGGFQWGSDNMFGWAELNSRDLSKALPFYGKVFGWDPKPSTTGDGGGGAGYTEFHSDGQSIAGAQDMNPMVPAQVPSYWGIYFNVDDVDKAFQKAVSLGAQPQLPPQDFPGGRFAIVADPQGASFGLLKLPS